MDYSLGGNPINYISNKVKYFVLPTEDNGYKSRFLQSKFLMYGVVLLLVLKITTTFITINLPYNVFFANITESTLENFVNQTRQSIGLKPLAQNSKLDQAAQLKAQNMVQNNYFNHTSPSGISPWFWFVKAGYNYKYAGENLAIGFFDSQEVYNAWLNSASHKANIVNPNYTEVGTAVLDGFGPNNTIVVVQEFGSQLPAKTVAQKNNNASKPLVTTNTKTNNTQTTNTQVTNNKATNTQTTETQVSNTEGTNTQTVTVVSGEKVLSQSTESQGAIEAPNGLALNNLSSKLMNSVLYNHEAWIQDIIYGISLVVIGILLSLIFFNFHISFKKQLVFRSVLILVLLSVATLINREAIISIIPHQIFI